MTESGIYQAPSSPAPRTMSRYYKNLQAERRLRTALLIVLVFAGIGGLAAAMPSIDRWERENGYPFGLMCQVTDSCTQAALERLERLRRTSP